MTIRAETPTVPVPGPADSAFVAAWRGLARASSLLAWWPASRAARRLFAFAIAEKQSELELRRAAARVRDPRRRALYLVHALDEARHARTFARRAHQLAGVAGRAPRQPVADVEHLFDRLGEVGFLAFVHLGEARGRAQFEAYAAHFGARGDARGRATFAAILTDERRHEAYTRALLVELAGGEGPARRALRRAAAWEAWRAFRRVGRSTARALYAVVMAALFVVAAPWFTLRAALRAREARGARRGSP